MAVNENHFGQGSSPGEEGRMARYSLHPLHEAAMRLADLGRNRSRSRSKDLVALLLSHGARAWRYSQPEARIHLNIGSHSGRKPVILRLR